MTKHMRIDVPPPSSANDRVEAEGKWASGVNDDGSFRGRKWEGKEIEGLRTNQRGWWSLDFVHEQ